MRILMRRTISSTLCCSIGMIKETAHFVNITEAGRRSSVVAKCRLIKFGGIYSLLPCGCGCLRLLVSHGATGSCDKLRCWPRTRSLWKFVLRMVTVVVGRHILYDGHHQSGHYPLYWHISRHLIVANYALREVWTWDVCILISFILCKTTKHLAKYFNSVLLSY